MAVALCFITAPPCANRLPGSRSTTRNVLPVWVVRCSLDMETHTHLLSTQNSTGRFKAVFWLGNKLILCKQEFCLSGFIVANALPPISWYICSAAASASVRVWCQQSQPLHLPRVPTWWHWCPYLPMQEVGEAWRSPLTSAKRTVHWSLSQGESPNQRRSKKELEVFDSTQ